VEVVVAVVDEALELDVEVLPVEVELLVLVWQVVDTTPFLISPGGPQWQWFLSPKPQPGLQGADWVAEDDTEVLALVPVAELVDEAEPLVEVDEVEVVVVVVPTGVVIDVRDVLAVVVTDFLHRLPGLPGGPVWW